MPTDNPRVNVTLSPSLFELVSAMSRGQRVSRSQVLRELLEAAEPALQRVVALMHAAERAKGAVKSEFGESMLRSQRLIEDQLSEQLAMVGGLESDLVTLAERIEGRRPGRTAARPGGAAGGVRENPPASNRGVKSAKTTPATTPPHTADRRSAPTKRLPKGGRR